MNYYRGSDPSRWRTNVSTFAQVKYEAVYPGIDLVYHGTQGQLEYDVVVAPGADPGVIRIAFDGAASVRLDASGDLVLQTPNGELRQKKPVVYQRTDGGSTKNVDGEYVVDPAGRGGDGRLLHSEQSNHRDGRQDQR